MKTYIKKNYRNFAKRIVLWKNRVIINYGSVRFQKKHFNIILNEKFEKYIKRMSRFILLANIILVFVILSAPLNIIVAISLICVEQVIERIIFSFKSEFVMPPTPSMGLWRKAGFEAMVLGGHLYRKTPGTVGMYFKNEEAAKEVFQYVYAWNFNKNEDLGEDPYIRITFVINRKKDKYAVFVSPHLPENVFEKLQLKEIEKIKQGKEPMILVAAMVMCKLFNFKNSGLEQFLTFYRDGYLYDFQFYSGDPHKPRIITPLIRKNHLNIKNIEDLTQKDIELFMCKYNIDWDDNSPVPKSIFWRGR
jgi:hypothetical protein